MATAPTPAPQPWEMSWLRRLANRYGHRTLFLALTALAWIVMAIIIAVGQPDATDHLFHTYLPIPVRTMFWLVPAVGALIVARTTWEWVGFTLICLGPAQRAASYLVGMVFQVWEGHWDRFWEYSGRFLIWLLVIALIWVASDWPNSVHVDEDGDLQISDDDDEV